MAKDVFHDIVKQALENDGWLVTHDPYRLSVLGREGQVDLGADWNIVDSLLENGVLAAQIVLGFVSPALRPFSQFANP